MQWLHAFSLYVCSHVRVQGPMCVCTFSLKLSGTLMHFAWPCGKAEWGYSSRMTHYVPGVGIWPQALVTVVSGTQLGLFSARVSSKIHMQRVLESLKGRTVGVRAKASATTQWEQIIVNLLDVVWPWCQTAPDWSLSLLRCLPHFYKLKYACTHLNVCL